jgi:hypothetical protein
MTNEKGNSTYWRQLGLIVVGAMLASIPTLVSTHLQSRAELQQLVLDRRLTALKDFSIVANKAVSEVVPRIDFIQERLNRAQ